MNIGIDLLWLKSNKTGGLEYFIKTLLSGLKEIDTKNTYYLLVPTSEFNNVKEFESPNFKIIDYNFNNLNKILRVYKENTIIKKFVKEQKIDLAYFPNHNVPLIKLPCKTIATIQDMRYSLYKKGISFTQMIYYKLAFSSAKKNIDKLIITTNSLKNDFTNKLGLRGNIYIIPIPIKVETKVNMPEDLQKNYLKKWNIETKKYIYTVSSLMFHKNLSTLLTSMTLLKEKNPEIRLVISGVNGNSRKEVLEIIKEKNIEKNVILTGFVSEEEKQILYNNAALFVFPSFLEGFGIPPIEAALSGIPVIVSDIPVMKEVLKNNYKIIYINKYMDPTIWASRILKILDGNQLDNIPDETFIQELKKRYDPKEIARLYLSVFEKL